MVKIKLWCLIKNHAMKACGEVEVYTHSFLTSGTIREWSATFPIRFNPAPIKQEAG
jgi:hypothetical protein